MRLGIGMGVLTVKAMTSGALPADTFYRITTLSNRRVTRLGNVRIRRQNG